MLEAVQRFDVYLLQLFNNWGSSSFDGFWLFVTQKYIWIPVLLPLFYLAIRKETKENQIRLITGLVVLLLIVLSSTELVKVLFTRLRPCNNAMLDGCFRELIHPNSYSFYSGHTASSMSIAVYGISLLKKQANYIWFLALWAIIFSYSRMYLAVHYPSDILIGGLMGYVLAILTIRIMKNKYLLTD